MKLHYAYETVIHMTEKQKMIKRPKRKSYVTNGRVNM